MPPAFLGEIAEASGKRGRQVLLQPEQRALVVGVYGVADMVAESGMGLFGPGAVPAGELDQCGAVALLFGPDRGLQQDGETARVVALVGGGERAGIGKLDPVGGGGQWH